MKKINFNWQRVLNYLIPYLAIIILTTFIISNQLIHHATFVTADRYFHFSRFYDAAQQIKTGNYSYFQNNYTSLQSGRIINALYGPFFAYLNGLLVLITGNWFTYQIVMDYIVYLVGGMAIYRMTKKVAVPTPAAILLALIYLTLGIMPGWIRADNFMAWGAALAPYVIMCGIDMVQDKNNPVHWIKLMLLMSILAQIHLLSTVILAAGLIPFAIYALITAPDKKRVILNFIKAIAGTLVLTANIWGSFIFLYHTNKIALPKSFKLISSAVRLSYKGSEHGQLPLLVLILIIAQVIYVLFHLKENRLNTFVTLEGGIILLIASRIMPWNYIQHLFPALGRSFQFPYRLMIIGYPLLFLGIGLTVLELKKHKLIRLESYLLLVACLSQTTFFTYQTNVKLTKIYNDSSRVAVLTTYYQITNQRTEIRKATEENNLGELFEKINRSEPDYLPIYAKKITPEMINLLYRSEIIDQAMNYQHTIHGSTLQLKWKSHNSDKVRLPVVMYKQSQLKVNGKNVTPINLSAIGAPLIKEKAGINTVSLTFVVPIWFWSLVIISLIGWIILIVLGLKNMYKIMSRRQS